MESIWGRDALFPIRPTPPLPDHVDAAVIGAGIAGIEIAWRLQRAGLRVAVLEQGRICGGQTQNTTAKITVQHGLMYDRLIEQQGREAALQVAHANLEALREYRDIARSMRIDCGMRTAPSIIYTTGPGDELLLEALAARELDINACFTTDTELPFPVQGAVRVEGQALFHPLRFLRALAGDLTINERTRVLEVEGDHLLTTRGELRADHVVFATHFPFINAPGYYFLRMHQERSYVLALQGAPQLMGMYLGVDGERLSLRSHGGILLLGGGGHRTGENAGGGHYERLRDLARELFPAVREVDHWSAQDCMTVDGLPFIGRYAANRPNWYVATGFGKWGMTTAMVAATIIGELIVTGHSRYEKAFSPQRFDLTASAKNFMVDSIKASEALVRGIFSLPQEEAERLPPGHGGIVEVEGHQAGVYKEPGGRLHIVNPICPHLGCRLEWNPDERSWDCPCHGSRFDHTGRLLDGPAQENL